MDYEIDEAIKQLERISLKLSSIGETVDYTELVVSALEKQKKYEMQWPDDMNNPLEPLKLKSALDSEIRKFEYRKANKPEDINILDYTIMYALAKCLKEYAGIEEQLS